MILDCGLKAGGETADAKALIAENGILSITPAIGEFLTQALGGTQAITVKKKTWDILGWLC